MTRELAERLRREHTLRPEEYRRLLEACDEETFAYLRAAAAETARARFGNGIYVRGLVEIGSRCRNDCRYCGIRRSNRRAERYRLTPETILDCCRTGYGLGFRTFVLQGGEDPAWDDGTLTALVAEIRRRWSDCAITLSLGERSAASYEALFRAGATRYLLRHETADQQLYAALHPAEMSHARRLACLETLRRIGYQTGTGMMVGVPGQTIGTLVEDLLLIERLRPQMIGIGPFLPHGDTPLGHAPAGSLRLTLLLLAILRLMRPAALIPATTALATLSPEGRRLGILSGANVVMPNLSPAAQRAKYAIYEHKAAFGCEAAEGLAALERELTSVGYRIDYARGDYEE